MFNVSVRVTHVDAGSRWVEFVFSQRRRRRRRESRRWTFVQQDAAARQPVLHEIPGNEHGIRYAVISAEHNKSKSILIAQQPQNADVSAIVFLCVQCVTAFNIFVC